MLKEYPLITKKEVKKNKSIKKIQKNSQKHYKGVKGKFPKARISKVVELKKDNNFFDLTENNIKENFNGSKNILERIENCELTGLSGNGFSTAKKIKAAIEAKVKDKYLIVNAVECDPGLLHDKWLMEKHLSQIEEGISVLSEMLPFKRIVLASKEACTVHNNRIEHTLVPNKYPMGQEKILIEKVLGIKLDAGQIPSEQGILVLNVQTVLAINEIAQGIYKKGSRYITVADFTSGEAIVAKINGNSTPSEILKKTLGVKEGKNIFAGGGIMFGHKVQKDEKVSAKTNFVAYGQDIAFSEDSKCKKCGACAKKCPMGVKVHEIVSALEKDKNADISMYQPELCINCGTCTYHCRAGKNTMNTIQQCIK